MSYKVSTQEIDMVDAYDDEHDDAYDMGDDCKDLELVQEREAMTHESAEAHQAATARQEQQRSQELMQQSASKLLEKRRIARIIVEGNKLVPTETILEKIPYHQGEIFRPEKTAQLIRSLYAMGYFRDIKVQGEDAPQDAMHLVITVQEKRKLEKVVFEGNKNLSAKDIEKKLKVSEIVAMDPQELANIAAQIKKLYRDKDFHNVEIETRLENVDDSLAIAYFTMKEGSKTLVKRVFFEGNSCVSSKALRNLLFTREDWLFGFINKAGSYQPMALEMDKQTIENYYQSRGHLTARVTDIKVENVPCSSNVTVTFVIDEGEIYTVSTVKAQGNEILKEDVQLRVVGIRPGDLYSREKIRESMETLKSLWGECGYAYAEVEPSVIPDPVTKTVAIEFHSTLGNKIYVNRINLSGNKKTQDKVIRRRIAFCEGDLLTINNMDASKAAVEGLGYFEARDGVNWKITRIDEDTADATLVFKERRTGSAALQIGYGGQGEDSPTAKFNVTGSIGDINTFGTGVRSNLTLSWSKQDMSAAANIFNPWIFDRPIGAGLDAVIRRMSYDEFRNTLTPPQDRIMGGSGIVQFTVPRLNFLNFQFELGGQDVDSKSAQVFGLPPRENISLQQVLNQQFKPGSLVWIAGSAGQDFRNHPMMPSRGYQWLTTLKWGIPHQNDGFGFVKFEADAQWITPLINERDLILRLHGFFGYIKQFKNHRTPYRELFHIGGPSTVRGFLFGEIGPNIGANSLGAQKAFVANVELLFPIAPDNSVRGVLFYDGGAGWDTPHFNGKPIDGLRNNDFNYRHAVGFGVRLTSPAPMRIDVGFKLDPNRRLGESGSEVHFSMSQDF